VGSPIEETDALVALSNAKTNHISALSDYKIAEAKLVKAMEINNQCGMGNAEWGREILLKKNSGSMFPGMHLRPAVVLMFLIVLVASSACSKAKQGPPKTRTRDCGSAEQKDIRSQLKAIGNGEAYNTVSIKSQVNGELAEVYFKEGQDVKKAHGFSRSIADPSHRL